MSSLICPFCGAENAQGRTECATCGSPMPTMAPPVAPTAPAAKEQQVPPPAPVESAPTAPAAQPAKPTAPAPTTPAEQPPVKHAPTTPAPQQSTTPAAAPPAQPTPVPAPAAKTPERTIAIEVDEESEHHDVAIDDQRAGQGNGASSGTAASSTQSAPNPPSTPKPPASPPVEELLPEAGEDPALDEESPWLAITVIIGVVVLIAGGIVFVISKFRSVEDMPPVSSTPIVSSAPVSQEVVDLRAEIVSGPAIKVSWTNPSGLTPNQYVVVLRNLSASGVVVQTVKVPGAQETTTIREVTAGTKYLVTVQVDGDGTSTMLSQGASVEITPEATQGNPGDRDVMRRSDLADIKVALDGYAQRKAHYPIAQSYRALLSRLISDGLLTKPLNDPLAPKQSYEYTVSADLLSCTIAATMEESASDAPGGTYTITCPSLAPVQPTPTPTPQPTPTIGDIRIKTTPTSLTGIVNFRVDFQIVGLPSGATVTWVFGDGRTSRDTAPMNIYTTPGTYTAVATVRHGAATKQASVRVTVLSKADGAKLDSDGDGLTDEQEKEYGTNPLMKDTDQDGFTDKEEVNGGYNPLVTNKDVDSDGDGLMNWEEVQKHGTDPFNPDTDGDGYPDGVEVANGYDPLVFNPRK